MEDTTPDGEDVPNWYTRIRQNHSVLFALWVLALGCAATFIVGRLGTVLPVEDAFARLWVPAATLTPYVLAFVFPMVLLVAVGLKAWKIVGVLTVSTLAVAGTVFSPSHHPKELALGQAGLRVGYVNSLMGLADPRSMAQFVAGVDVFVLSEAPAAYQGGLRELLKNDFEHVYYYNSGPPTNEEMGLWVRKGAAWGLAEQPAPVSGARAFTFAMAPVGAPAAPGSVPTAPDEAAAIRVVAVHLDHPLLRAVKRWDASFDALSRTLHVDQRPTVLIGDFNATQWYPRYGAFTKDNGLADCAGPRRLVGNGTWRTVEPVELWPVTIDHVLVRGLVCAPDEKVTVVGTDHAGLRTTVARRR